MTISGLPLIPQTALPADIRNGSKDRKQAYEAALGFERSFIEQLTKTMADTAQASDDDTGTDSDTDTGADAATKSYQQMLPGTLADALTASGGLGLARQLVPIQVTKR